MQRGLQSSEPTTKVHPVLGSGHARPGQAGPGCGVTGATYTTAAFSELTDIISKSTSDTGPHKKLPKMPCSYFKGKNLTP